MAKPTNTPDWASTTGGSQVEPSGAKKILGFTDQEKPPFQYFNWFWALISEWITYLNGQFTVSETTTGPFSYTTPSDSTGFSSAQQWLYDLPLQINHDVILKLSGSGYNNQTLIVRDFIGVGSITIEPDTVSAPTENLRQIDADDIHCDFRIEDLTIDGQTFDGINVRNCRDVTIDNVDFTNCDYMVVAVNSIVDIDKLLVYFTTYLNKYPQIDIFMYSVIVLSFST